ncbi:GPW/gp25 family protein [uncultured Psychroserpens sp.]|uniref:GPW/gp25 family protein n=1 Tax=uncultured Psychroserpens sp. TaxID=255436 RepID=UPI002635CE20|nr:GPW/gp25 family protein [uncultured Psychroserpens sp.]
MDDNNFLGKGWSFPPAFDLIERSVVMVNDEEDIQQSLNILLNTGLGERILRSDFGCGINTMPFENITTTLLTKMERIIEKAILKYEPRIDLEHIFFSKSNPLEGVLYIQIEYKIRATNSRMNYVYPFYIKEGTHINN